MSFDIGPALQAYVGQGSQQALADLNHAVEHDRLFHSRFFVACTFFEVPRARALDLAQGITRFSPHVLRQLREGRGHTMENRPRGISAVVRTHNEAEYLKDSLLSIYNWVEEIIVILHRCTDHSAQLLAELNLPKVKVFSSDMATVRPDNGYLDKVVAGGGSFADYTNWCFSHATYSHLLRWDGDMIAYPSTMKLLREALDWHTLSFAGDDLFLAPASAGMETRMYRAHPDVFYVDTDVYELLQHHWPTPWVASVPMYVHMKYAKGESYRPYLT